ncbi:hypothetical protein AO1008_00472 [Aspergillus oryzae 100-8]|uniref:AB hydrolase-1 domain-containing protein n=1 Tax=Aspergillus oryzae (strain 3.042) TaxID=1160506 RepID=I8TKI7_ASPO3|nr:hypothetical protein Ao3042_09457 [Aspergillus oryzae 3.042]KDE85149.1 hypothetical protein AO1008_00472 [Aspergillus oryzae 100-8]|eukprot:EIT74575.1 hypothetical protein Ao3042_09457 [Aspergillus oryzae 3.042]
MTISNKEKPVFVLVPGASQNPAHYAHLLHLLQSAGYGATTGLLPSIGAQGEVTAADDADYVRNRLILPVLDIGNRDVILISHSYSGMPASAAARGLGPADRAAEGKTTSVVGQIFIATILPRGGLSVIDSFGGHLPPHMYIDSGTDLVLESLPRSELGHRGLPRPCRLHSHPQGPRRSVRGPGRHGPGHRGEVDHPRGHSWSQCTIIGPGGAD